MNPAAPEPNFLLRRIEERKAAANEKSREETERNTVLRLIGNQITEAYARLGYGNTIGNMEDVRTLGIRVDDDLHMKITMAADETFTAIALRKAHEPMESLSVEALADAILENIPPGFSV